MGRKLSCTFLVLALSALFAQPAGADPTKHFTELFPITCGDVTYVLVSKQGSSTIITANGAPSNSVSVLFRLIIGGETIVDKPLPNTQHLQVCTGTSDGLPLTAWTIITPG
jgi:hypothetical protein